MRFCLETDRYGFLSRLRSKVAAFGNVPAMASQLRLDFRIARQKAPIIDALLNLIQHPKFQGLVCVFVAF